MDQGHLELTLPGGERRYYETLVSGLSARLHIRKPDFFKKKGFFSAISDLGNPMWAAAGI